MDRGVYSQQETGGAVERVRRQPGLLASHQEGLAALIEFPRFCRFRLELVAAEAADFVAAACLCDGSRAPLRAGDALPLAICWRNQGALATMMRRLRQPARKPAWR